MWRKPGSEDYDIYLPAEAEKHFQALVLASAGEFESEQEAVRVEAIRVHNEAAKMVAQKVKKDGLRCPHCLEHSHEVQFIDRSPTGWSFFQCPACGQTFRLERFKR